MTFITGSAVLSRKSSPIDGINGLDGAKIAVLRGTTTEDVMRSVIEVNSFNIKVTPISSHDEGMELLNAGKVSGYASDRAMPIGQVFRNANASNEYALTRSVLSFEPYAFMIPRGDTEFRLVARSQSNHRHADFQFSKSTTYYDSRAPNVTYCGEFDQC